MSELINKEDALAIIAESATDTEAFEKVKALPSAEPEVKLIEYRDCANVMLRMWMDNVVTDGEYKRIMDKLNAHWEMENE